MLANKKNKHVDDLSPEVAAVIEMMRSIVHGHWVQDSLDLDRIITVVDGVRLYYVRHCITLDGIGDYGHYGTLTLPIGITKMECLGKAITLLNRRRVMMTLGAPSGPDLSPPVWCTVL